MNYESPSSPEALIFSQIQTKDTYPPVQTENPPQEVPKSQFAPFKKPKIFPILLKKGQKNFRPTQKPLVFPVYRVFQQKTFQVFSKVCQILEFHENRKIENFSESFSIDSNSFYEQWPGEFGGKQSFCLGLDRKKEVLKSFEDFMRRKEKMGSEYRSVGVKGYRQAQLLDFKEKAKQKELMMQKRKRSVIKIQAAYKGYKQRQKFSTVWQAHLEKRRFRHLKIIGFRLKVLFAPYVILNALKKWLRIRKAAKRKVSHFFLNFSATFIQKYWKGYKTRKKFLGHLNGKKRFRANLRALVQGWKIRKILKSSKIVGLIKGINDLIVLKREFELKNESNDLSNQISNQLPIMRERMLNEITRLYNTGYYVKASNLLKSESVYKSENEIKSLNPIRSREEEPVKSLIMLIGEQEKEELEPESLNGKKKPEKIFKNFLKRGQNSKYNPSLVRNKPRVPSKSPEKIEISEKIPKVPKVPTEFEDDIYFEEEEEEEEVEEEEEEDEEQSDFEEKTKEKKTFLKRKSKKYQPHKVEWNCKSRIDCWGEGAISAKKLKKKVQSPKKTPIKSKSRESFDIVEKLEKVFAELTKHHLTATQYFSKRLNQKSSVPQLLPNSKFIKNFLDEGYQETFEHLQVFYLSLCNEEQEEEEEFH